MNVARYLRRSALPGPWRLENVAGQDFSAAIVIPALAESAAFPETLAKLERNPSGLLEKTLVVVVVNNTLDTDPAAVDDNRALLEGLRHYHGPIRLGVVDAASPGCELPLKEGVGAARKIGFDLVLPYVRPDGFLVSLDADTWVEPDYLPALYAHFAGKRGGVVINFCHREGTTPELSAAIIHYELFLRGYVLGLRWAGSPYAVQTVGSAFACDLQSYMAAGGMNRKTSGEDFYFLQQLIRGAQVEPLSGTTVHPAARLSSRVPFGTGPRLAQLLHDPDNERDFYPAEVFDLLKAWLETVASHLDASEEELLRQSAHIAEPLAAFLEERHFAQNWRNLRRNHRTPQGLHAAFHGWFDGLRTRQLLRRLVETSHGWRRCTEALPPLLHRLQLPVAGTPEQQLHLLRALRI